MSYVQLENLQKSYGASTVLSSIDMSIEKGEFVTLLGPSGCGKSTILRIMAGLTEATAGTVKIENKNMENVPTKKRGIGMVFQSYALFPNMTVNDNVAFGLKIMKLPAGEIKEKVRGILEIVGLSDKGSAYPNELSGGQQQRVALARALIVKPKVLLLDEPLSALDAQIRKKLQADLRSIQTQMGITMILVTHDQEEAMAVSDKIFVMNHGEIAQCGTPTEIYTQPQTEFIANFIGRYNVFGKLELEGLIGKKLDNTGTKLAIRPESISFEGNASDYRLDAVAQKSVMSGNVIRTQFQSGDQEFSVEQLHHRGYSVEVGKEYHCYVSPEDVIDLT